MLLFDIGNNRLELGGFGLKNEIRLVDTHHFAIGWDWYHLQPIGVHQFGSLCLCCTSHAREFVVHAEIVLQSHSCERLVFFLDLDALFGLNRLVDTLAPATAFEDSPRKFVDNFYFTILDDVVLVALVQHCSFQCYL